MNEQCHIGLFYSYGPHFMKTARALRLEHPDSRITAFLPQEFPVDLLADLDITAARVLPNPGAGRSVSMLFSIVRAIRAQRLDLFVVLFNSPRLRLLSALSNARECQCRLVDGRSVPVRFTLAGGLAHTLFRRLRGNIRYARIWIEVHTTRIGVPASTKTGRDGDRPDGPGSPQA